MGSKNIAIIGAGTGGLIVANELRRTLPSDHKITVIEKESNHALASSFLWLMIGKRKLHQISSPVFHLLRPGIEFITASVKNVDPSKKTIDTDSAQISYDYLVIAAGAELAFDTIPGFDNNTETFYTAKGSEKLYERLESFQGSKIAIVVAAMPYKCPGAPHEGAMLVADFFCAKRKDKVEVHLFTPEPQPMPVAGPELGGLIKQMLESKGIAFHPLHKLASLQSADRKLTFEGNLKFDYDMLIMIPPHRSPQFVRDSGIGNESGWIPVDRGTLMTKFDNIFAIGDITAISIPGRWKPDIPLMLPKAGVFAHSHALIVAKRIVDKIQERKSASIFCGEGFCMLEAGEGLAGFAYGDFFAESSPKVQLKRIGKSWHWGKVLFEKWWLAPRGIRKELLKSTIEIGAKILGVPIQL